MSQMQVKSCTALITDCFRSQSDRMDHMRAEGNRAVVLVSRSPIIGWCAMRPRSGGDNSASYTEEPSLDLRGRREETLAPVADRQDGVVHDSAVSSSS